MESRSSRLVQGGFRRFGGRDHTTVLHACKKIVELQETDPGIREDYQNFMRLLTT